MSFVELVRNLLAHAQKPVFVFRLNGRVHLNRRGSQFSRLLAAEVCASALVMLDTLRPEVVWEYWLPTPFGSFPFTSPPVRHRVPPGSERSITQTTVQLFTFLKSNALSIRRFKCRGLLRRIDGTTTLRHVGVYQSTRCHIPEDLLQQHQSRNVRDSITNLRGRAQHSLKCTWPWWLH